MIKVIYYYSQMPRVEIRGHALFSSYGRDIVCSAVSSLSQFVAEILKREGVGDYNKADGYLEIKVTKSTDFSIKMIYYLIESLKSISKDYPRNIKVEVRS
ncbi:ribosomal-processing cysteine protease Prp [Petrotoga sp. 9PWA.NaAc.5.4]|uniref:ribosomal-processing cysteine protease Prp n=1 Tax=Petrotoga sp. 9PWA.NaAc.5.4 TaxID=1434328 RepID=UPI000CC92308|nr:ribosomal-processing cysteine protease Prp [Petrotoga sp. 9PWA.NaAc.5.4]PNR97232.1 hypothetical protein X924_01220 [Petrotoga sp. 9PWA.NaAc.5.4]